jgi:putative spermidine/putrescine transport system ATP-binding protein
VSASGIAIEGFCSAAGDEAARPLTNGHTVDLRGLTHRFGATTAINNVTLAINAGEIMALLGPSGCGKTTLLRVVAGFVRQSSGSVLIDRCAIDDVPPNKRAIGIVFQNYALFPHMTVAENIAYGLKARGRPRAEVREKVGRLTEVVRLTGLEGRLPRQLSGGQQQRVALARALAVEPSVLLLDEPFSALDKSLRLDMQIEIKRLQRQFRLTAILVTHDQDEAMSVADRIAVMNRGRVEQCDTPVAVYDRPATLFVSGFIGTTNQLNGRLIQVGAGTAIVDLDAGARVTVATDTRLAPGAQVVMTVRPEQLVLHAKEGPERWPVRRRLAMPIGPNAIHDLETRDGATLKLAEPRLGTFADTGSHAWCAVMPKARVALFEAAQSI